MIPAARLAQACDPTAPEGCAICGDEALRALVLGVDARTRTAIVSLLEGRQGAVLEAALDLVDDIARDDLVLVHQGFVIGRAEQES